VFTGLWLARSKPAEGSAVPHRSTDPDAATTSNKASVNSR
jgi:DHA2 family methylenomycin A resistance protein-like MFS transporter